MEHFFPLTRPLKWLKEVIEWPGDCEPTMIPDPKVWKLLSEVDGRHFLLAIHSGIFFELSLEAVEVLKALQATRDCLPGCIRSSKKGPGTAK